jgi:hypothetical protein
MLITTSETTNNIETLRGLFDNATKNIKADALSFIDGIRNKKTARAFIGLSKNSKMPAYTFAIPARLTCPRGDKLAQVKGTVCSGCYATKGHDAMKPAIQAKQRRWNVADLAANNWSIRQLWIEAFVIALNGEAFFRWHSAGDLYSDEYRDLVSEAIYNTPATSHWIPTREARMAKGLTKHSNAVVRVSDDIVDQKTNKWQGNTSGVHVMGGRGTECGAYLNEGQCGDCRACWNPDVKHVSYKLH